MSQRKWPPRADLEPYEGDSATHPVVVIEVRERTFFVEATDLPGNRRLLAPPMYSAKYADYPDLRSIIQIGQTGTAKIVTNPRNHRPIAADVVLN